MIIPRGPGLWGIFCFKGFVNFISDSAIFDPHSFDRPLLSHYSAFLQVNLLLGQPFFKGARLVENLENPAPSMQLLIQGCKQNDRESQRLLYQHYYGYAISICARYCRSLEESKEVVNDGFMKVFKKIDQHETESSFKAWLRRIMINAAIDHYRKEVKHYHQSTIDEVSPAIVTNNAVDDLSYAELIGMIQRLSPAYRAVFNLHVIDGFTHEEVSGILGISEGTSKSNLMKARENLKSMLDKMNRGDLYSKYV